MSKKISVKTLVSFSADNPTNIVGKWKDGVEIDYDLNKLDDAILARGLYEAFKSKVMDAHSGSGEEGIAACREASDAVWDNLLGGDWNRGREGVGGWIVECLADLALPTVVTLGQAKEVWDALSDDDKKTYAKAPAVKLWKANKDAKAAKKALKESEAIAFGDLFATTDDEGGDK